MYLPFSIDAGFTFSVWDQNLSLRCRSIFLSSKYDEAIAFHQRTYQICLNAICWMSMNTHKLEQNVK